MRKLLQKSSKLLAFFIALAMTSLFCLDSTFVIETNAQTLLSAEGIVEDMGVGWNLGNSLDSTGATGVSSITDYERAWGNPVVTEDLIKAVKSKGFNTIRVPVTWYEHITESNGTYTIDTAWLARVKQVVDYAYNNGMYVILNVHHEKWVNRSDLANSYSAISPELKQVWTQIAAYFSSYDQHLIFEGMNEPRAAGTDEEWSGCSDCYNVVNKLNADFISTVRSVDSPYKDTRLLMVPGYAASCSSGVYSNLDMTLFDDPYVAVSIHAYSPYNYTMGDGDHSSFSASYKAELEGIFGDLRTYFTQDKIPVVIGEFSASNYGYTDARLDWAECYMTLAKEIGAACVLWDNNVEANNGGEAHGYINRSNNTWYSSGESVVNKLISVRNDSSIPWAGKSSYPLYSHEDYSSGTTVNVASDGNMKPSEMSGFVSGTELAIKYNSDAAPVIALMNSSWGGWTTLSPYDYSYFGSYKIAYVKYDDIYGAWDSSANGELAVIQINNINSLSFSSVAILNVKSSEDTQHTHTLDTNYSSDSTGHWYACSGCSEKVSFEKHTEDSGTVTTAPTETSEGVKTYKCTKCGYVIRTEPIAKLDHTHNLNTNYSSDAIGHWYACSGCSEKVSFEKHTEDSGTVTKEPTETTEGVKTYKCTKCGYVTRTETIAPWSASPVTVSDGTETKTFDSLEAALTAYRTSTANITITLNKNADVKTLSLPTKAAGITITGSGALNVNAVSISIPANTTINVPLNGTSTKPLAVKTAIGKTLNINGQTSNIGTVSGTKTSVLNVNENMTAASLLTFGEVNAASGKALTVTGNVSAVTMLNGTMKLPTATSNATVTTAGNAEIVLTETNGKVAKTTVNNVTGSLTVNVVNAEGEAISLTNGTTILYSAKDISEKVSVANKTADNKPLNAFYYTKTRSIKAEWADAITLSYGGNERKFPNLELAFASITDKNTDYIVTLNTDVTATTFVLPRNAKSITINGTGTLTTGSTSIAIPVDTAIGCKIIQSAGKTIALKAAAGKTLTINTSIDGLGTVSGTKTSVLKVNENLTAANIMTFGEVKAAEGKVLTVTGRVTAVTSLDGTVKLPTAAASAAVTTAGNAEFTLTDGSLAKVTVNSVGEALKINVVNADGETVTLASGTTVLYTAGTADYTDKVTIANKTSTGLDLTPFLYTREIKAEYAGAVTLYDGTAYKAYPNVTLPLAAMNDMTKDYVLILNEDISTAKLVLPVKANSLTIKSASDDNIRTLSLTGITALSARTSLTLENVRIESTRALTISAAKDLTLDNFVSDSVSAVKGGSRSVLSLGKTSPIDKISGFGTVNINSDFKAGTLFTTTALNLGENAGITVPGTRSTISAKTISGTDGSYIMLEQGFTPVRITGTTADSVTGKIKIRSNGEISESAILFTTRTVGNGVFDVTEIQPAGSEFGYTIAIISGKAYIRPIALDLNGVKYALWTDVISSIESAKASAADYTVTVLDDYNVGGVMRMPSAGTYGSLTVASEGKTLSFTGNVSSTGALNIVNTNLDSVRNGVSFKYAISAGKYPFSAENVDFNLASGLSSTGDAALKNVTLRGTLRAGVLTLNGTNTVLGTVTVLELRSTESGAVLNILNNARGVLSVTKNGIAADSENITVRLTDANGNAVTAENGAIIASSFRGGYDGQLKLSTENGIFNIVLNSQNRLVLESEINNTMDVPDEVSEPEETSDDEDETDDDEDISDDGDENSDEDDETSDEDDENSDEDDGNSQNDEDTEEDTEESDADESEDDDANTENGDEASDIPLE